MGESTGRLGTQATTAARETMHGRFSHLQGQTNAPDWRAFGRPFVSAWRQQSERVTQGIFAERKVLRLAPSEPFPAFRATRKGRAALLVKPTE